LRTQEGPFSFARGGARGEVTEIGDSALRIDTSFDSHGRPTARTMTVAGNQIYGEELSYDAASRISQRIETVQTAATTLDYHYDQAGRLTGVDRGGSPSEASIYDMNGNRTSRTIPGPTTEAMTYDTGGRITKRGSVNYAFDAGGMLSQRGPDTFSFDALGQLQ